MKRQIAAMCCLASISANGDPSADTRPGTSALPTANARPVGRRGLLNYIFASGGETGYAVEDDSSSVFSIGTLLGLTVPLYDPTIHTVNASRTVVATHSARFEDYLLPGVYVLPSVSVFGPKGQSLSIIVPAGLSSKKEVSIGLGLSYGFALRKSVELGIALTFIWTQAEALTDAQQTSLSTAMPLPMSENDVVGSRLRPSVGLGVYLTPLF